MFLTHFLEKCPEGWWVDGRPGSEAPGQRGPQRERRQLYFLGWAVVTDETGGKSGREVGKSSAPVDSGL